MDDEAERSVPNSARYGAISLESFLRVQILVKYIL
jgi:hypothetical protein